MKKLIHWLRAVNQYAQVRAQYLKDCRLTLADMDGPWRQLAGLSDTELTLKMMGYGLSVIKTVFQGQQAAQNLIRSRKAALN